MPVIPNFPKEKLSDLYTVTVNGKSVFCIKCKTKGLPFATGNVDITYDYYDYVNEEIAFLQIDLYPGESVQMEVIPETEFTSYAIRPLSKKIASYQKGKSIFITVDRPMQFTVEPNDHHRALHVFVNAVEEYPDVDKNAKNVRYFGEGEHFAGRIRLQDGDTLFLDYGAWVHASVREEGVKNIKIIGHGVLDRTDEYDPGDKGGITAMPHALHFERCENVLIDGITIVDSPMWTITTSNCNRVDIHNVKMVGMWNGSTDGLDVVNSQNISLTDSFLRNGDDNVTIKGFAPYESQNNENITVKGCVFWCDWGVVLQIGAEACADYYRHITFEDCDIIHMAQAGISMQTGGYAEVSDIRYENIRVEYAKSIRKPELYIGNSAVEQAESYGHRKPGEAQKVVNAGDVQQKKGYVDELFAPIVRPKEELKDVRYHPEDKPYLGWLIHVEICEHWHDILCPNQPLAWIHDVRFKDITVTMDEGLPMPPSKIKGQTEEAKTCDVLLENLTFNGKKAKTLEEANLELGEYTENIRLI